MRSTKAHAATAVPTVPAAMQALLHERLREATEPADRRRENMPAALQARDNLRRRFDDEG
ncbi:hypothetical protein EV188_105185 [Actinomycetospora succinea]|uniref:Uncharacterized protein n=1 Tax=Actinomycetospora succinea TaxID=663603 RepID=A0A4R6V9B5_9PSEU|nr:hypothetical protein [Actinomycetospora succinea]TDQ55789.1 hypothetical protein EV188_105185 [Actinomycetospora succinea]